MEVGETIEKKLRNGDWFLSVFWGAFHTVTEILKAQSVSCGLSNCPPTKDPHDKDFVPSLS